MAATQVLLFLIVGRNEPLFEAEFHKRGAPGNSDAVARQNYFVVHSALDLVEKACWTTQSVRRHQKYCRGSVLVCQVLELSCTLAMLICLVFFVSCCSRQMYLKVIDKVRTRKWDCFSNSRIIDAVA